MDVTVFVKAVRDLSPKLFQQELFSCCQQEKNPINFSNLKKKRMGLMEEKVIVKPTKMALVQKYFSFAEIIQGRDATVRVTDDGLLYAVDLVMVMTGG